MAGVLATIRKGLQVKAEGSNPLPFPSHGGGSIWSTWANLVASRDLTGVGDGLSNSIVTNTLQSKVRAFSEPPVREYMRVDGQDQEVPTSDAARLIREPNQFMDDEILWGYAHAAIAATGSAYFHKLRNASNTVIELWPLYPAYILPHTPQDGSVFIDYWEYSVPGKSKVRLPVGDVIHLRLGINPEDHRTGRPLLGNVLAEIYGDEEALSFSTALLKNMGVPGVIMTPRDPNDPGPQGAVRERLVEEYREKFGGDKRGDPLIVGGGSGMNLTVVSFSPEQMNFTALRRVPEERISGALGWPAILAGLGAGLDRGTYSNAEQLREYATEQTLIPEWGSFERQLTRQLLREFTPEKDRTLQFDLRAVRALQKDENSVVDRLNTGIGGGWVMVSEGRREAGLPVEKQHEIFLRPASVIEIDAQGNVALPMGDLEDS